MSAPVISSSSGPAASSGATGANSSVSLSPLGNPLFSSLLSMGLSNFSMTPTTPQQGQEVNAPAANTDKKIFTSDDQGFKLQQALLISPDELDALSKEDLESLLSGFGETSDELSPKILVALTPGVPANDAFEAIKAKFAEMGVDTSKFTSVSITAPTTPTDINVGGELTVDTNDATQSVNFLLITTGFTPSEMGPIKDAIKSVATPTLAPTISETDNADEVNASAAAIVMMAFVVPIPKPVEAPITAQDMTFDLSAMSAFTQQPNGLTEEPDWTKKLSDKLNSISLTDNTSPFDTDASPFDDEMNAILSLNSTESSDEGYQGSIAATRDASKDVERPKTMAGEISAQALSALNHSGALSSAALHHLNGDAMLMINGNMLNAQNMSSLTNPIFTSGTAIGTHPAVQAVAVLIEKAASGSEKAKQELSVQLDPPELGRMQVHLSMEKDGIMKVHLLTERQETLNLFQRDAHALKSALDNAGIQVDNSSLTFDLASGDQSFNQLMGGSQDKHSKNGESRAVMGISGGASDIADVVETKMDFTPNAITGNVHYSFWA